MTTPVTCFTALINIAEEEQVCFSFFTVCSLISAIESHSVKNLRPTYEIKGPVSSHVMT